MNEKEITENKRGLFITDLFNFNINSTQKIWIGIFLLGFSLILPRFVWFHQVNLLENLYSSISLQDSGLLFIASAKLIFLNTARHLPIYAGAFIMGEGFHEKYKISHLAFIVSLITIPVFYNLISMIYDISFVFAGPAYLTILLIFIIHKMTEDVKPISIKILIISLFLFGFDWLDIVPFLSQYGFGRGEISISIKQATEFIGATQTMNFLGLSFFAIILVNAIILSEVVIGYYHRLNLITEAQDKEKRLKRVELEAIESRYLKEMKHLVHDLKTPLVTIQGLSGVIDIKSSDEKIKKYANKISETSEKMSLMISEILNKDKMHQITLDSLMDFIKVQLSMEEYEDRLKFNIEHDTCVYVNKFRMSRAVVNLIDNALKASSSEDKVVIEAYKEQGKIRLMVKDKGKGISEENLEEIWKAGFTTDLENTGLGLNFVKEVVENHDGEIDINSKVGHGTEIEIALPEVDCEDEKNIGS